MTEHFFGPWRVQLNRPVILRHTLSLGQARLSISGSAGSDGDYDLPYDANTPFRIDVDGSAWDLDLAIVDPRQGYEAFGEFETRRANSFDRTDGMIAIVEVGQRPTRQQPDTMFHIELRCVSIDPAIHPGDPLELFDFTVLER